MTNCEWFNSKLESYFCDSLTDEELLRCRTHLAACAECRQEIDSLQSIDAGVRKVFEHRLGIAQRAAHVHARPRVFRLAMATAGLAVAAAILGLALISFQKPSGEQASDRPTGVPNSPPEVVTNKVNGPDEIYRSKPGNEPPAKVADQSDLDASTPDGPPFEITDPAGYIKTLETYKGHVLLFGVVSSEQKTAVKNLQQLYDAFGANPRIRILAVLRRDDNIATATFPKFFNHGSKLLGLKAGEFMLLDDTGNSRLQGLLSEPSDVTRIRSELGQLMRK